MSRTLSRAPRLAPWMESRSVSSPRFVAHHATSHHKDNHLRFSDMRDMRDSRAVGADKVPRPTILRIMLHAPLAGILLLAAHAEALARGSLSLTAAARVPTVLLSASEPILKVCTFGGQGACSIDGLGVRFALESRCLFPVISPLFVADSWAIAHHFPYQKKTAATLRFLSPPDGPPIVECSCLARCDRGAAVGKPGGMIEERVNGAPACAALLRAMGYTVDQRLSDAYAATERAEELVAAGSAAGAMDAYESAFNLAVAAGLGDEVNASETTTVERRRWLAGMVTKRSRLHSELARPSAEQPFGEAESAARAVEDALYAVRMAESTVAAGTSSETQLRLQEQTQETAQPELVEDDSGRLRLVTAAVSPLPESDSLPSATAASDASGPLDMPPSTELGPLIAGPVLAEDTTTRSLRPSPSVLVEAWERLAESYEDARDIEGAIYAYDRLLALEPPTARWLSPERTARRGMQELVLLSHRRGLTAETRKLADGLQSVGETSRVMITKQAISDLEELRRV